MKREKLNKKKKTKKYKESLPFSQRIKNWIAEFIYFKIFKGDKSKVPYPIFLFILKQFGGWAGVGIYLPMRQYEYKAKMKKVKEIIVPVAGVLFVLIIFIISMTKSSENFIFGFSQEFLSNVIFTLLILYFLPRMLNPPKKYEVQINRRLPYGIMYKEGEKPEFIISIRNNGKEVFKQNEIHWELYIFDDFVKKEDFIYVDGSIETTNQVFGRMWKITGENSSSLFVNQEKELMRVKIDRELLIAGKSGEQFPIIKIYYIIRSIGGNFPPFDKVTKDFMGIGIPVEQYPQFGEISFEDWIKRDEV